MNKHLRSITDPNRIRKVAYIENQIDQEGICNFLGLVLSALEWKESELLESDENFEDSPFHQNLDYQMKIVEFAMSAVDLDTRYGHSDERKKSLELFQKNMKNIGILP